MGRGRPRVEGRTNARTAGQPVESQAPKDARLVPQQLSELTNPRAVAARRMLKNSNHPEIKTGETHTRRDPCTGLNIDSGVET